MGRVSSERGDLPCWEYSEWYSLLSECLWGSLCKMPVGFPGQDHVTVCSSLVLAAISIVPAFQRHVFFLISAWTWGSVTLCLSQVAWHFNVAINSMGDISLQLLVHSQVTPVPSKRLTCWEKYFHKQSISKSQGHDSFHMQTPPAIVTPVCPGN